MELIPDMLPMFRLQVKEEIRTPVQLHIQPHGRSLGCAGIITTHCVFPPTRQACMLAYTRVRKRHEMHPLCQPIARSTASRAVSSHHHELARP